MFWCTCMNDAHTYACMYLFNYAMKPHQCNSMTSANKIFAVIAYCALAAISLYLLQRENPLLKLLNLIIAVLPRHCVSSGDTVSDRVIRRLR